MIMCGFLLMNIKVNVVFLLWGWTGSHSPFLPCDLVNSIINLKDSRWQEHIRVVQTELHGTWITPSLSDKCFRPEPSYCISLPWGFVLLLSFSETSFTLKSLMCRNSSMIDLDFLAISNSDNAGLSGAAVAGISGFATNEVKKSEEIKQTKIVIKMGDYG